MTLEKTWHRDWRKAPLNFRKESKPMRDKIVKLLRK